MKKSIFCGFFLIALSISAQEINKPKLDSLLSSVEVNDKGMGSLSVYKDGKEIYAKSIGYADVENQVKSSANTRYRVGSITKMFTAAILMQLVEEGRLSLDQKLSAFYPGIPNAENITISHLLRHQSGIFNFGKDKTFQDWKYSSQSKEELLERFENYPADFAPGEKSAYSNTNYILLSFIIEDLEDKSYPEVLNNRILEPLNLENTYYGSKIDAKSSEAYSYKKLSNWKKEPETDLGNTRGAGALISTPQDLNKFIFALYEGELVSKESLEIMQQVDKGYGLGMYPISFYKHENLIGHTGGIDGFASMLAFSAENNMSIAYSSNGVNMPMDALMEGIFSIALGKEYEIPEMATLKLTSEELQPFTGIYGGENFPFKINVFVESEVLMAQGTGQPKFPLDAIDKNKFKFDRAGLTMEFHPVDNKMIFTQGTNKVELLRE